MSDIEIEYVSQKSKQAEIDRLNGIIIQKDDEIKGLKGGRDAQYRMTPKSHLEQALDAAELQVNELLDLLQERGKIADVLDEQRKQQGFRKFDLINRERSLREQSMPFVHSRSKDMSFDDTPTPPAADAEARGEANFDAAMRKAEKTMHPNRLPLWSELNQAQKDRYIGPSRSYETATEIANRLTGNQ